MASDESWVFDSLVNFLHGNIWKIPVIGFIEEKSVVFDPDSYNNMTDDKEDEFRKIHDEYKGLVDFMLSSFMEDLQVSPEQVEEACRLREAGSGATESHVTKAALEQLQAAEDFTVFRRIMTRKNIDLQLQSLELLVAKYGVLSPSLRSQEEGEASGETGEDDFLQVVIRYCDQNDIFQSTSTISDPSAADTPPSPLLISSTIHNALKSSSTQQITPVKSGVNQNLPEKPLDEKKEQDKLAKNPETLTTHTSQVHANLPKRESSEIKAQKDVSSNKSQTDTSDKTSSQLVLQDISDLGDVEASTTQEAKVVKAGLESLPALGPTKGSRKSVKFDETTVAEIATVAPEQHRTLTSIRKALDTEGSEEDSIPSSPTPQSIPSGGGTQEDIQRRREYLQAQRDKLVALKKREREKQFEKQEGESKSQRPKSARAAKIALTSPAESNLDQNEKQLAARRALAERLKQELFEK